MNNHRQFIRARLPLRRLRSDPRLIKLYIQHKSHFPSQFSSLIGVPKLALVSAQPSLDWINPALWEADSGKIDVCFIYLTRHHGADGITVSLHLEVKSKSYQTVRVYLKLEYGGEAGVGCDIVTWTLLGILIS